MCTFCSKYITTVDYIIVLNLVIVENIEVRVRDEASLDKYLDTGGSQTRTAYR